VPPISSAMNTAIASKTNIVAQYYISPSVFTHEDTDLRGCSRPSIRSPVGVRHRVGRVGVDVRDSRRTCATSTIARYRLPDRLAYSPAFMRLSYRRPRDPVDGEEDHAHVGLEADFGQLLLWTSLPESVPTHEAKALGCQTSASAFAVRHSRREATPAFAPRRIASSAASWDFDNVEQRVPHLGTASPQSRTLRATRAMRPGKRRWPSHRCGDATRGRNLR